MRLVLTRPKEECGPIKGHEVVYLPLIKILPPQDKGNALQAALAQAKTFDWLVVTSQNTVRAIKQYSSLLPSNLRVAAVGLETARALQSLTDRVFVPQKPNGAKGLLGLFKTKPMKGKCILYPRSNIGGKELAMGLNKMGAKVTEVVAYQTRPTNLSPQQLKKILSGGMDAVLFFSPSAVKSFFTKMKAHDPVLKKIKLVAMGPATRRTLKSFRDDLDFALARNFGAAQRGVWD